MKKTFLAILFALISFASAFAAVGDTFTVGGVTYKVTSTEPKEMAVSGYTADMPASVTLLANLNGGIVTSIDNNAFNGCTKLTSIEIPYAVTTIGDYAFNDCSNLASIKMSESLTSIGNRAFYGCSGLTSVTIPSNVTSIGDYAFCYCSGLTSVTIPNSVTSIGNGAFSDCSGLTSVTIPNSVTSISFAAFSYCRGLTSVTIPNSVTSIGYGAFSDCSGLTSVTIPISVTSIGNYAFYNCSGLTSVTIPNSVTSIGNSAFSDCSGLTSVTIPNSVTSIGEFAFSYCSGLTSVTIPNSVTSIGYGAFSDCSGLTSVTIPNSVTSIGEYAFTECSALTEVNYDTTEPVAALKNIFSDGTYSSATLMVAAGGLNKAKSTEPWMYFLNIDEEGIFRLNGVIYTLYTPEEGTPYAVVTGNYLTENTDLVIPESVSKSDVDYPVTAIDTGAFKNCTALLSIEIPNCVTSIGTEAFNGCSKLASIKLPSSLTLINNWTFQNCSSLSYINIPNTVTSIGDEAFKGCQNIISIEMPIGLKSIGVGTFYNCKSLISIEIPNAVTSISNYTFCNCTSLTNIGIPSSVTSIGNSAFSGCTSLTSIEIPASVPSIGTYTFYNCTRLTSIEIPASVKSIGNNAFKNCTGLISMTCLATTPPTATETSFANMNKSDCWLYVPQGCANTYRNATNWDGFKEYVEPELVVGDTFTVDGVKYKVTSTDPKEVAVSGYTDEIPATLTLPAEVNGYAVTSIADNAFNGCTALSSIEIPASVESIGQTAFYSCKSLTGIEIPNSVTSIKNNTFNSCTSLTSIEIPASVKSIGDGAFRNCTALSSIEIPSSVTSIGSYAFYNCSSLSSIEIPSSVTLIGNVVFANCTSLTSITCLGTTPPSASENTFNNFDKSACTLNVPKDCANIYKNAANWDGFKMYVEPELVVGDTFTIGGVIYKVSSTDPKEVTVSGYTDEIPATVIIPAMVDDYTVTSIGDNAFENSSNLTSIEIPASVTSIGDNVFANCTSLTSITCLGTTPPSASENTFINFDKSACTLNVPKDCANTYKNAANWDGFKMYVDPELVVGDTFTIGGVTYKVSSTDPKEVTVSGYTDEIPATLTLPAEVNGYAVTSIADNAFNGCTSLTNIEIPSSVTSIGIFAFYNCSSLSSIEIPNSVTSITNYTFLYCTSLTSIKIPSSVTLIGNGVFANCASLTSITCLGTTPPSASKNTFINFDKSACTLNVPKDCANTYKNAANWDGFKMYVEPELVVGDTFTVSGVTYKVTSTDPKEVTVSGYTDEIPATVIIPAMVDDYTVTSIGDNAFENSSNLTSIEIPASVTSIGDNVFADCTSLTSITCLGTTPPAVSEDTFYNFDKSACTLNVPIGYTDTYGNAENWDGFKAYIEHITTGIEDVIGDSDSNTAVEVYNLNGVKVADSTDNLRSGLYIIRRKNITKKVVVK